MAFPQNPSNRDVHIQDGKRYVYYANKKLWQREDENLSDWKQITEYDADLNNGYTFRMSQEPNKYDMYRAIFSMRQQSVNMKCTVGNGLYLMANLIKHNGHTTYVHYDGGTSYHNIISRGVGILELSMVKTPVAGRWHIYFHGFQTIGGSFSQAGGDYWTYSGRAYNDQNKLAVSSMSGESGHITAKYFGKKI